jgi:hypothetical protein
VVCIKSFKAFINFKIHLSNYEIFYYISICPLLYFVGNNCQISEFAPIGAKWWYHYQNFLAEGYVMLESIGDTVILSQSCKKISVSQTTIDLSNPFSEPNTFFGRWNICIRIRVKYIVTCLASFINYLTLTLILANDFIYLSTNRYYPNVSAKIYDFTGKEILNIQSADVRNLYQINVADLSNGMYVGLVFSENEIIRIQKIIKQ